MNPQTCTKFGANRSSRLTASQDFWICDPLTPPPPPRHAPWGIEGQIVFIFPDESTDVNQSWCQSVQPFDSFPWLLNVWPPKPPKCPLVSLGAICLAYIHSRMNLHMCTKCGANRISRLTSSPDFWICDPLTPPPPNVEGRIVLSLCPFPDESADVYQMWCQSVQPFDSLPDLDLWPPKTPRNAPCVLRFIYPFATGRAVSHKNTPKNNIYTSKIIIPARTCRLQRH